jgi:hypothetical protein
MKTQFKLLSFLLTLSLSFAATHASAQQVALATNSGGGPYPALTGLHSVPNAPAVTVKAEPAMVPATTEEMVANSEIDIAGSVVENHLLILTVRTQKSDLTTAIYDGNGNRLTYETFIDAGSYRMVDHTRNLKPGTYYLHVMERGKVIEKEKFLIK